MGKVSGFLRQQIKARLDEHGVVIWYDKARAFERVIERLELEGVRVAHFRDSYFRLRYETKDLYSQYEYGRWDELPRLLVYVPRARLPERSDVLLGMAKAGDVFEQTLAEVARQALQSVYAPSELDELLANERLTLEDLDRLSEPGARRGIIPLIFGTTAPHEIAARYLAEPAMESVLEEKGALPALVDLLAESFGFLAEGVNGHEDLKRRLVRHLLLNEFLDSLREGVEVPGLARVARPASPQRAEACRRAAAYLRDYEPYRQIYMRFARQVASEYGLHNAGLRATDIGGDTFPVSVEAALAAIEELVAAGWADEALRLLEERKSFFWVKYDELLSVRWQAAGLAVKLVREARRVEGEVRSRKLTPEAFVRQYAQGGGEAGNWWRADQLHRQLEARVTGVEDALALDGLLRFAREAHRRACELLAERFAAAIAEQGFDFGRLGSQADIFRSDIMSLVPVEPVAYFLVDALRYEMGMELYELLGEAAERAIRPAVAVPPTITQIGMAALLPGAEKGLGVVEAGSGAAARIGNTVLRTSAERMDFLRTALVDAFVDMPLDDLLSMRPKTLAARVAGKRLVVVRSQEIDSIGEQGSVHLARQVMSQLLSNLRRAMQILARAGVARFVVTADHGFLLLGEELSEAMKVDPPGGQTVELHRRCWIGRGGAASDHHLRYRAPDLGLGGDLEFAFPRGLGAFKAPGGNQTYFHGGLSLQELVVPVLTLRLPPPSAPEKGDAYAVRLTGERVTNRIFTVTVRYDQGTLLSPRERHVRCVGVVGRKEVAFAATAVYGYDPESQEIVLRAGEENHITLVMQGVEGSGTMVLQLVDASTGAVLAWRQVSFDLTF